MHASPRLTRRTAGRGRNLSLFAALAALVVVAMVTMEGSRAAFNAQTSNGTNTFAAGTVTISDDDANSVMFTLPAMVPTVPVTRCINVTYTGSVTADVRLYGSVGGTGLAPYLTTVIEIGTGAAGGATFSCTGFTGPTTLHNDTLAAFATANTNYATGLTGFTGATNPTTRSYRFTVTLTDDDAAQGLTANATLTWESQNV